MRTASPELIALLDAGGPFFRASLFTFTLADGTVYRYTSADIDMVVGGQTYLSTGPQIEAENVDTATGLEVSTLSLTVYADQAHLLAGVPWTHAIRLGKLYGARVRYDWLISDDWQDTSYGTVHLFDGRVSDFEALSTEIRLTIKSDVELLDIMMPHDMYQPSCLNTLFDARCKKSAAAFKVSTTVGAGSTLTRINTGTAYAADYFALGKIVFTSGVNQGLVRSVREYSGGQFLLSAPLVEPCAVGDTFDAWPGCDGLQSTCSSKYNNVVNFRGHPYVPEPESLL